MKNYGLNTQQRDSLVGTLRQLYQLNGIIPMDTRRELADAYNVSVELITHYVSKNHLTKSHKWTEEELKDVWCNYEKVGIAALAQKYDVSHRAIYQQIVVMRRAPGKGKLPWKR